MLLKRLFFLLKAIYIIETIINIYSLFHDLSHSHALFCTPNFFIVHISNGQLFSWSLEKAQALSHLYQY